MRDVTGAEEDIVRLFNPKSVAVVGASSRPGALSWWPLHLVATKGFTGDIYPINPSRDEIEGLRCYDSIGSVPGPVDLAVVALGADKTVDAVQSCADAGVRNVVLPAGGFGEVDEEGARRQDEIARIAAEKGMRVVGPNTDGIANLGNGAIGSIQPLFDEGIFSGPVGLVTQSGATASSLLYRLKTAGIGCKYYASTGNEIDLGLADYMSAMVQDPDVRIVLVYVETLRKPDDFRNVAKLAMELGKPVALIKVGRSEQGARRAAAHTGSLAGADQLYDALFASCGVMRVSEMSELVAIAKIFLTQGAPKRPGAGIISVSGGAAGALADKASEMGVPVPAIGEEAETRLSAALRFGAVFNPCDLTGEVATNPTLAQTVYEGFSTEESIGTIVYARKHLTAGAGIAAARLLGESATQPGAIPLAIYAMDGEIWGEEAEVYEEHEIPVFNNLNDLYTATNGLAGWSDACSRPASAEVEVGSAGESYRGVVPDDVAKRFVEDAGLPLVGEALAQDRDTAMNAAEKIGFPVVLKIVSERIPHKTEAGGVAVGIRSRDEAGDTFDRLMANARDFMGGDDADGVLVQEQVEGGTEIILGLNIDPNLGPFVLVGLGGITTELMKDVSIRPAPVDIATARGMIDDLRGKALLHGYRGEPPRDVAALADSIVKLSAFGAANRSWLSEADLNPLIVMEDGKGVRAVDILLIGQE